jgi:hypothetical protein
MAWSRGFFRLWIVGTVVWLIFLAVEAVAWYNEETDLRRRYDLPPLTFSDFSDWWWVVLFLLVPPVVLVLVVALSNVVRWVLLGFQPKQQD